MSEALKHMKLDFTVDDLPWEGARVFYRWWLSNLNGDRLPRRRDFNPMKFARHLPNVMLTDVGSNPRTFDIRLAGTEMAYNFGDAMEGREIRELRGGDGMFDRFSKLVVLRKPYYATGLPLLWANKDYSTYDVIMLPLENEAGDVVQLLTHLHFN